MHYCQLAQDHPWHQAYHDQHYGFPIDDDNALFGRLILEINQAGLSWLTILKKADAFQQAFDNYNIQRIAAYTDSDRQRLLSNAAIIRNRRKIDAVIHNAQVIQNLQKQHGSFHQWLQQNHPLSKEQWVKLFRQTFRFTGPEITGEFLMSTGYLPGAHQPECPIHQATIQAGAPWAQSAGQTR